MKLRWVIIGALGATAVIVGDRTPVRSEYCVATVGQTLARVDLEQARYSSLMAAIAQRESLPPRATTIAIATAFQESKIRNIDYGDRDSLGLFQQRPSQGWGTEEQLMDPGCAIATFYRTLADVPSYQQLPITDAAQRVQRSAYPDAYADHESYARALASSLRGYSPAQFSCVVNPSTPGSAKTAARSVDQAFGISSAVDGDDLTVNVDRRTRDNQATGWAVAHYLVANAQRLGLLSVSFDRQRWTAETSDDGWQPTPNASSITVRASTN